MLAPPGRIVTRDCGLFAVGRVAGVGSPIGGDHPFHTAFCGHFVEVGDGGKRAIATGGGEENVFGITRPTDDIVGTGMKGELLRFAAFRRDDEDIVVAETVRREGHPLAVGREAGHDLAAFVTGEAADVGSVFGGVPEVALVADDDASLMVGGLAEKACLRGEGAEWEQ